MVDIEDIVKGHPHYDQAMSAREKLIDQLSEFNEELADKYLLGEAILPEDLNKAIKKTIWDHNTVALQWGSVLKNRGIQPLLESVITYLPSPAEKTSIEG